MRIAASRLSRNSSSSVKRISVSRRLLSQVTPVTVPTEMPRNRTACLVGMVLLSLKRTSSSNGFWAKPIGLGPWNWLLR